MIAWNADQNLQVIQTVDDRQRERLKEELKRGYCAIHYVPEAPSLYIRVEAAKGPDHAVAEIQQTHSHFTRLVKNGTVLLEEKVGPQTVDNVPDKSLLNVKDILEYAETVPLDTIRPILQRQIDDNMAIAEEGLRDDYGARVGKTLQQRCDGNDARMMARALAAAGSDARMNGCPMAVVINSGSGNQGITVSVPVIVYAKEQGCSEEKLLRALAIANLTALHQKYFIGYLSAFCGVVSAAAGAGCGICWLAGGSYQQICSTLTTTIGTIGGMVCDGAKSSCAGKIAAALETAFMAVDMALEDRSYPAGEGLMKDDPEKTIRTIGRMAVEGMRSTDNEILNLMLEK
jgi:L-cysteine desulfidase